MEPDELLTIREAASQLHVHPDTLRRWEKAGHLVPLRTPTGHRRFSRADIARAAQRAATQMPQDDRIHWHGAGALKVGVSRFGDYFIASDRSVIFKRPGGDPELLLGPGGSDTYIYRACVDHHKMLLAITP
jgi:excisionase family DNA binding protein